LPRSAAPRFFVDGDLAVDTLVELPAAVAHHVRRVLRIGPDASITLFNGRGGEYAARLQPAGQARIEGFDPVERESPLRVTLIQSLVASDKLDWTIEKAVELGVAAIVIAPAQRSVIRLGSERLERRRAHWREIAIAACCQCGRNRVPALSFAASLDAAFAATDAPQRFALVPEAATALASAAPAPVAIAVGPEGGFTDAEVQCAGRSGFLPANWGPRTLRTETAGLAALAALQTLHGDAHAPQAAPI
jgi:16S rRNA (uracil1498-N3)-methyltransferase